MDKLRSISNTSGKDGDKSGSADAPKSRKRPEVGQIVLVLQGGGALGAYQGGVYEAMHEAGIEPDWVIGISIGAINAGLIAGNASEDRLGRLKDFWQRISQDPTLDFMSGLPWLVGACRTGRR
jgi:NTE family protein